MRYTFIIALPLVLGLSLETLVAQNAVLKNPTGLPEEDSFKAKSTEIDSLVSGSTRADAPLFYSSRKTGISFTGKVSG